MQRLCAIVDQNHTNASFGTETLAWRIRNSPASAQVNG